jgi:YD repeat-containing protein
MILQLLRVAALGSLLTTPAAATADGVTYAYYPNGRLQSVTWQNTTTVITYTYDAAGNRTSVVTQCSQQSGC